LSQVEQARRPTTVAVRSTTSTRRPAPATSASSAL